MMASEVPPDPFSYQSVSPTPDTTASKKKTWNELRAVVKDARKLQWSLMNRTPSLFSFRTIQTQHGEKTRVYFLGILPGSKENTLVFVDIPNVQFTNPVTLLWQPMLDEFQGISQHNQFSKEEQLLRERKRLGSFGITSYELHQDSGKFLLPACNSLFVCQNEQLQAQAVFPKELKTQCSGVRMDPKFCPCNPNLVTFINNHDIWITCEKTGEEKRLTFAHKGSRNIADDPLSAGVASFVVQEEFDRYTGYWWQPQSSQAPEGEDYIYRILYEEVDESDVEVLHIVPQADDSRGLDEFRYPSAGTTNAKCTLKVLEIHTDCNDNVLNVTERHLVESLQSLFPWMEYIVRVGWTPDGSSVWVEILDRLQQRLSILLIPLESFVLANDTDIEMKPCARSKTMPIHVLYEDKSDIWINVHDILHFFPSMVETEITYIYASEKSGFRHLYRITSSLHTNLDDPLLQQNDGYVVSKVLSEVQLTEGDWEVYPKQLWVDHERHLVYFMGLMDTPLENHLYVTSYTNPGQVQRLTELGYYHAVNMSKDCLLFSDTYSSISEPPAGQLCSVRHCEDGTVVSDIVGCLLETPAISEDYRAPELFNFVSRHGHQVHGMVYKPHHLEPGIKYPTVLFVYGGPQVQLVNNTHKGLKFFRLHTLSTMGYAVVVVDVRGSNNRGLMLESHIKNRMGTVEIEDEVEGLEWAVSNYDFIDPSRVAIHGWSYGGYLSLMGLAHRPDVFKLAIAGAPVTTWKLYDTGYTERYLGTPESNPDGYKQGSVLNYIDKFPFEENRLLIVHGLIDENVHFHHTSLLVNALSKACKPYQLQVYPNERHGIRNPNTNEHYETMVLSFLQQHL